MELENQKQTKDLKTLVHLWIERRVDFQELIDYTLTSDDLEKRKLAECEVLCCVLGDNVFYHIDSYMAILKLSKFVKTYSICDVKIQNLLHQLIKKTEESRPDKNVKLCQLLFTILRKCTNAISEQTINTMYFYLIKSIDQCQVNPNQPLLKWTMDTLAQLPVHRLHFLFYRFSKFLFGQLSESKLNERFIDWRMHQNFCCVMRNFATKQRFYFWDGLTKKLLFVYLMKLFVLSRIQWATILSAILLVEKMCLCDMLRKSEIKLFIQRLKKFSKIDDKDFDPIRYQVKWCARWCLTHVMCKTKQIDDFLPMKVSRFEARNDTEYFPSTRSLFSISSGAYFYEVIPLTANGEMRYGWSTREARLSYNIKLGQYGPSIGFDPIRRTVWSCGKEIPIRHQFDFEPCDAVIGCLIDCDKKQFVFSINGVEIFTSSTTSNDFDFDQTSFYATASLSPYQHCKFNFGQKAFLYPPSCNTGFKTFYSASGGNQKKYQLAESFKVKFEKATTYWFKQIVIDNKVELFFRDQIQHDYDNVIEQIEIDIQNNVQNIEDLKIENENDFMYYENVKDDAVDDIDDYNQLDYDIDETNENKDDFHQKRIEYKSIRFIQSVIETMGNKIHNDKVVLMAVWIGQLVDKYIDRLYWIQEKLFELIHPYLTLHIMDNTSDITKHRTFCIVLFNLFQLSKSNFDFMEPLQSDAFDYLIRVLSTTGDNLTKLFVLLCMQEMELNENQIKCLKVNPKFIDFTNFCYDQTIEIAFKQNPKMTLILEIRLIDCQIHFVSQCLLAGENVQTGNNKQAVLNSADQSAQLSTDLLSARCDSIEWQSARSVAHVTKGAYFFETLLLTNGAMRIGWSTKRHNFMQNKIGDDKHSIAFDGYNRCVWHSNERIDIVYGIKYRWTAGDVIGCLIRVIKDHESDDSKVIKFTFYLNGRVLNYNNKQINSSVLPYHATVSLSTHQQCYFNFGQLAFKYPPKDLDYFDFTIMYDQTHQDLNQSQLNLSNAVVQSSMININSINNMGDLTISQQKLKVNQTLTGDNLNKKRKIETGFITCKSCHKQMFTKRLKRDCCNHIEYSAKISSISTTIKQNQISDSLAEIPTTTLVSVPCKLCYEIKQTRPLQFVDCNHMQLCRDCVPSITDCPKCLKQQFVTK